MRTKVNVNTVIRKGYNSLGSDFPFGKWFIAKVHDFQEAELFLRTVTSCLRVRDCSEFSLNNVFKECIDVAEVTINTVS